MIWQKYAEKFTSTSWLLKGFTLRMYSDIFNLAFQNYLFIQEFLIIRASVS